VPDTLYEATLSHYYKSSNLEIKLPVPLVARRARIDNGLCSRLNTKTEFYTLEFEIMSQQSVGVKSGKQNGGDKSEKSFFSTFRAEPALLLQMLSTILVYMVVQDFLTEKVCLVNLGYSEDVCNALQSGR